MLRYWEAAVVAASLLDRSAAVGWRALPGLLASYDAGQAPAAEAVNGMVIAGMRHSNDVASNVYLAGIGASRGGSHGQQHPTQRRRWLDAASVTIISTDAEETKQCHLRFLLGLFEFSNRCLTGLNSLAKSTNQNQTPPTPMLIAAFQVFKYQVVP